MTEESKRKEKIRLALEDIRKKNKGKLTPTLVVAAAKAKDHPLHSEFDWDDKRAAQKQRESVARGLIRYLTVTVVTKTQQFKSVAYVRDPNSRSVDQGYVPVTSEEIDRRAAEAIMTAELDRCEAAIERARSVAAVLDQSHPGISDQLQAMLEEIVNLRGRLAEAA